jgi:hypothetical protein
MPEILVNPKLVREKKIGPKTALHIFTSMHDLIKVMNLLEKNFLLSLSPINYPYVENHVQFVYICNDEQSFPYQRELAISFKINHQTLSFSKHNRFQKTVREFRTKNLRCTEFKLSSNNNLDTFPDTH